MSTIRRRKPIRKERVIHARVPELLDDAVRRHAGSLGLSVSNLVRNVLENAFGLVEDIVADSAQIAQSARGRGATPAPRHNVLGWTLAVLNLNAVCDHCNQPLAKGTKAAIGMARGGPTPFRCMTCVKELRDESKPSRT